MLGLQRVELDSLHWGPGWTERPVDEVRGRLKEVVSARGWVADGEHRGRYPDRVWGRADTVV